MKPRSSRPPPAVPLAVRIQYAVPRHGLPAPASLTRWANAAWQRGPAGLAIRVVDAAESAALNGAWRHQPYPTNVLSFPACAPPVVTPVPAGDLAICASVLAQEAQQQGKALAAHWAHIVVHGVLHLQGHDHLTDTEAAAMERIETAILARLGYPDPYRIPILPEDSRCPP